MKTDQVIKRFRKLFMNVLTNGIVRTDIESFWIGEMEKAKKEGFKAGMKKILVSDIKEIDELKRILK